MVFINCPETEITEGTCNSPIPDDIDFKPQLSVPGRSFVDSIRWTSCITFHILLNNPQLWPLTRNEDLIRQVKSYAGHLRMNPKMIKSETVLRCKRKMVEDGIIPKDRLSSTAESVHKEYWTK